MLPVKVFRGHVTSVNTCAFVNASVLSSGSCGGELRLWDVSSGNSLLDKPVHNANSVLTVSPLPNVQSLITYETCYC